MLELNKIYNVDCVGPEGMCLIDDKSIDLILCDLPYGKCTECTWDIMIPLDVLWSHYKRIITDNGVVVLTSTQPFGAKLIMSNLEMFKYEWIWCKNAPTGFQTAPNRPMMKHENVLIFSKAPMGHLSQLHGRRMTYNPQGITIKGEKTITGNKRGKYLGDRPNQVGKTYIAKTGYPNSLLYFDKEPKYIHPTQKPVELGRYLVKTYTKENDLVLDNCCGVASFCIAAKLEGRQFIGMEKEKKYYELSLNRINQLVAKP